MNITIREQHSLELAPVHSGEMEMADRRDPANRDGSANATFKANVSATAIWIVKVTKSTLAAQVPAH